MTFKKSAQNKLYVSITNHEPDSRRNEVICFEKRVQLDVTIKENLILTKILKEHYGQVSFNNENKESKLLRVTI